MSPQRRVPSIFRIMRTDYAALLAVLFPLVIWGMYVATAFLGFFPGLRGRDPLTASDAPFFLYFAVIVTLLGIPLLIWRLQAIRAIFIRGVEIPGKIMTAHFSGSRGRLEYAYIFQGQTYRAGHAVHKTKQVRGLQPIDDVTLVVDPNNPGRALIRDIYV
jgi:hypothetical protein